MIQEILTHILAALGGGAAGGLAVHLRYTNKSRSQNAKGSPASNLAQGDAVEQTSASSMQGNAVAAHSNSGLIQPQQAETIHNIFGPVSSTPLPMSEQHRGFREWFITQLQWAGGSAQIRGVANDRYVLAGGCFIVHVNSTESQAKLRQVLADLAGHRCIAHNGTVIELLPAGDAMAERVRREPPTNPLTDAQIQWLQMAARASGVTFRREPGSNTWHRKTNGFDEVLNADRAAPHLEALGQLVQLGLLTDSDGHFQPTDAGWGVAARLPWTR